MPTLSPTMAGWLAEAVYGIRTTDNIQRGVTDRVGAAARTIARDWNLGGGQVFSGISGGVIGAQSGFAMILPGAGGETVVAARGTQTTADWLSNAHAGIAAGPFGLGVHAGFDRIYRSFAEGLIAAVPPTGTVHVVGHSLGGALANLVAAALARSDQRQVKLYTFGAPRVCLPPSAAMLQQRLRADNIYRVYNIADPVPMVPPYPYLHCPLTRDGFRVGTTGAGISVGAHNMQRSYIPLVDRAGSWAGLRNGSNDIVNLRNIDEALAFAGQHTQIPGGAIGLWALGKALRLILNAATTALGVAYVAVATVADVIAQMLVQAARMVAYLGRAIWAFVRLVRRWAGQVRATVEERAEAMTAAFLRWVLNLILSPLTATAMIAIDRVFLG